MSIFAGIFRRSLTDGQTPFGEAKAALLQTLTRGTDLPQTWEDDRFFLANVDVGAYGGAAIATPTSEGSRSFIVAAGHPHLASTMESGGSRSTQVRTISAKLDTAGDGRVLRECHGTFAICQYSPVAGRLVIGTDLLGARPLYYYVEPSVIYFATAQRILEAIPGVVKAVDWQGLAEQLAFKYCLGNRTCYADIHVLNGAEYLVCDHEGIRTDSYFSWSEIRPTAGSTEDLLDAAYETFGDAVADRCEGQSQVVATLSGGLDSRCIVTKLKELGKDIFAITWSPRGYIDGPLALAYGKAIGARLLYRTVPAIPSWDDQIRCLIDLEWPDTNGPGIKNLIFSGDGGSVGVGYDYLTAERVSWMRRNEVGRVVDYLLERHALPRSFLKPGIYAKLYDALREGVTTELRKAEALDPGRRLHVFYMRNDQQRHLHAFYESLDLHRVEYALPFYDSRLIQLLASGPIDEFLKHKLYHKWLGRFPRIVTSVAWQVYPGHEPCPVNADVKGRTQWEKTRRDCFGGKYREAFHQCLASLLHQRQPNEWWRVSRIVAAVAMHGAWIRPYGHVFSQYAQMNSILAKCDVSVDEVVSSAAR